MEESSPEPEERPSPSAAQGKKAAPKKVAEGRVTKAGVSKSKGKDLSSPKWNTSRFRGVTMHRRSKRCGSTTLSWKREPDPKPGNHAACVLQLCDYDANGTRTSPHCTPWPVQAPYMSGVDEKGGGALGMIT